jgi:hypothetical protein
MIQRTAVVGAREEGSSSSVWAKGDDMRAAAVLRLRGCEAARAAVVRDRERTATTASAATFRATTRGVGRSGLYYKFRADVPRRAGWR